MAEKRILFADADKEALEEFCRVLGSQWRVIGVTTGMAALAEMQKHPCEVVVACIDLPQTDGAELLNQIRVTYPETIRFITAATDKKERAIGQMVGGHQFLAKPFDQANLKLAIERSVSADELIVNTSMRELVGRIRTFPTIPSLYLEVIAALNNPDVTTNEIGAIVARDMAMTTKMLQVLNSAYFGLPHAITDPAEAVGLLGFDTVRSLIMSVKMMSQYDKIKPVYFSIDHVWRHSTNVAWIAKQFALLEVGEPGLAAAAYTAGLIHDVGKVILAANFDQQYSGAHALARKQQLPLWEVEKDIFGATHGEIGAYLFGLWGMPKEVVDAVAFHHHPSRSPNQEFTPLTAVHVANVLEYDGSPNTQGLVAPVVDMDYLGRLGLRDRLDTWREAVNTSTLAPARPAPRPTQSAPPSAAALPPPAMAPEQHPVQSWDWKNPVLGMIGLGTIVCVLCLVGFLQSKRTDNDNTIEQPGPALSLKLQGPGPGTIAKKPPLLQVSTIPLATAKLLPPPVVVRPSPAELAFNDLKLQGIFFSAHRPSAIINGKLTGLNEMVDACRVLEIGPTSVTVEFQSQRRVLLLK